MDVPGCLLSIVVHAANIHDTKGGISTAKQAYKRHPSIQKFCADTGYRGAFVSDRKEQFDVDISEKSSCTNGEYSLGAERLNAPSPGAIIPDASVKIMRFPSRLRKPWSKFPYLAQTVMNIASKLYSDDKILFTDSFLPNQTML